MRAGIIKHLTDLTFVEEPALPAAKAKAKAKAAPAVADPPQTESREVRYYNAVVDAMRRRARNTLHLALMIFSSRLKKRC